MEKKKMSLPVQIVLALILGIVVGLIFYFIGKPEITTNYFKPFGTIFVNLLKFIVVPVVLLSMIDGIISMGDMKKVGSVGWKTVAYFLVTTAAACVIGLVFANIFLNAGLFPTDLALTDGQTWDGATSANFMDTLVAIFPSNMWKSFTDANMLQVIVIALMFGGGILAAGEKGKLAQDLVSSLYSVIDRVMAFIISLSPIGVFTMMTWVVANQGPESPRPPRARAAVRLCRLHRARHHLLLCLCQRLCRRQPAQVLQGRRARDDLRLHLHLFRRDDPPEQGVRG